MWGQCNEGSSLCQYFEVRGLRAFGAPAHSNTNNDGARGGVLILHDTAHGITDVESFHIEGCGYHAFLWEAKARSILVAAVYFKTNESVQGPTPNSLRDSLPRSRPPIDSTCS